MAARVDAIGDYLRRTASLPVTDTFTACGWSLVVNNRDGVFRYLAGMEDTAHPTDSSSFILLGWNNSNVLELATTGGSTSFGASPSAATGWFFWAMTCSGTGAGTFNGYWVSATGTSFNTASRAGTSFPPAQFMWHNDTFDEWVDGRVAGIKVWDAVLTSAELWSERWTLLPKRRAANLHLFDPLIKHTDLNDLSPNGKTLTAGGTLTTEDGPPVAWGGRRERMALASPAAAGGGVLEDSGIIMCNRVAW